jgi:hypothetical protein
MDDCGAAGMAPRVKLAYGADGDATQIPGDAVGLAVNPAKLDVSNDEVATGASAGQAGGLASASIVSVSTDFDAQVVKASPGRLYGYVCFNFDSTKLCFVKFYDKATAPDPSADGSLLKWQIYVPPITTEAGAHRPVSFNFEHGLAFANGIALVITQDPSAGETPVDATDAFVQLAYK